MQHPWKKIDTGREKLVLASREIDSHFAVFQIPCESGDTVHAAFPAAGIFMIGNRIASNGGYQDPIESFSS